LFIGGAPRKIVAARVYGGPTEGEARLSLRIERVVRDGERESTSWNGSISLAALANGLGVSTRVSASESSGSADFELHFATPISGPVHLAAQEQDGATLLEGEASLDLERWASRARRRGGWIRGRDNDGLVISIAPERGAFVVGAEDPLLIRVERAGSPVPNARLTLKADGAQVQSSVDLSTDKRGRARVGFEATDLNPTLRVDARTEEGQSAVLDSGVPVVAGGMHALATPSGIRVESAIPRTQAFFSVVSDRARITGGALALKPDGHGGSFATAEVPALPAPSWLVVSSELDENSVAAIGWPLQAGSEPSQTFDVPDVLLLDGMPAAFLREQARRSRVRWLTAAFIASAFLLSVALLVLRARGRSRYRPPPPPRFGDRNGRARGAAHALAAARRLAGGGARLCGVRRHRFCCALSASRLGCGGRNS
jgi:hypothetical protein